MREQRNSMLDFKVELAEVPETYLTD